jgi:MtfA peptidase
MITGLIISRSEIMMNQLTLLIILIEMVLVVSTASYILGTWPFRARRRKILFHRPLSKKLEGFIKKNVPIYVKMPDDLKMELHGHINVLMAEKNFEGCGGLKMTDEIRATICAQAAILLIGRKAIYFPKLSSILVYPTSFVVKEIDDFGAGIVEEDTVMDGESWDTGAIVLAWDQVTKTGDDNYDGYNLVIHEFAHQLDIEDGLTDGVPLLKDPTARKRWSEILGREYKKLKKKAKSGKKSILDDYGAVAPEEFFAVATETFFEKPKELKSKIHDLYRELSKFYNLDPELW